MLAGFLVGFVVGLTGMGGGALMTPILVLLFRINPLAAVSSDIVAAVVMKPVGGGVHLRRGTVNLNLVRWLAIGSVPAAFCGVLMLRAIGAPEFADRLRVLLGVVLLVAGMTSVGSGSVMIVLLMLLYPALSSNELVGTDLVQAIPLVLAAAIGHLFFGDLQLGLTASLLLGSVPGVYLGARVSSRAPDRIIRPVLVVVLTISALKLIGASNVVVLAVLGGVGIGALVTYAWRRASNDTWGELTRDSYDEHSRDASA